MFFDKRQHIYCSRLVWEDEHAINCWTVSKHARSPSGSRAHVLVTNDKGLSVSIFQATSASFGKIYMMTSRVPGNKSIFSSFIDGVIEAWNKSNQIPDYVKKLGPIILIDNASIHSKHGVTFKRLPRYSPFINLSEFINKSHKSLIKKLFRRNLYEGLMYMLKNSKRGEKMPNKFEFMETIAHLAWKQLDDELPSRFFHFVKEKYFQDCLNLIPIHN
jgi:hypothetical protein